MAGDASGRPSTSLGRRPERTRPFATRHIEDIRVGERVMAHNPEVSDSERAAWQEPDFSQWLKLALEMPKPDGSTLKIELLRSDKWFIEQVRFTSAKPSQGPAKAVVNESTLIEGKPSASSALQSAVQHMALRRRQIEAKGLQLTGLSSRLTLLGMVIAQETPWTTSGAVRLATNPPRQAEWNSTQHHGKRRTSWRAMVDREPVREWSVCLLLRRGNRFAPRS